ncbi:hypothetical protein IEO21_06013 [Rhodonia placenta]|uniref:Uncharacterized protein n=1 Tax=Rhodonia placenta TaxID=104341 RepID=A0A8H7P143_9APHY|nr:hypothetical protein IEO21_06013 [Postia placenta]
MSTPDSIDHLRAMLGINIMPSDIPPEERPCPDLPQAPDRTYRYSGLFQRTALPPSTITPASNALYTSQTSGVSISTDSLDTPGTTTQMTPSRADKGKQVDRGSSTLPTPVVSTMLSSPTLVDKGKQNSLSVPSHSGQGKRIDRGHSVQIRPDEGANTVWGTFVADTAARKAESAISALEYADARKRVRPEPAAMFGSSNKSPTVATVTQKQPKVTPPIVINFSQPPVITVMPTTTLGAPAVGVQRPSVQCSLSRPSPVVRASNPPAHPTPSSASGATSALVETTIVSPTPKVATAGAIGSHLTQPTPKAQSGGILHGATGSTTASTPTVTEPTLAPQEPRQLRVTRRDGGTPATPLGDEKDRPDLLGWTEHIHLDGNLYYWHDEERIATTDDIEQPGMPFSVVAYVVNLRERLVRARKMLCIELTGTEHAIVRGVGGDKEPEICFIDLERGLYIEPIFGRINKQSIELAYESKTEKFWKRIEAFPMHLKRLPADANAEFLGALSFGASEKIFEWNDTAFPFSEHQSQRLLEVYTDLKAQLTEASDRGLFVVPAQAWHIARVMSKVEAERRLYKHGSHDFKVYRYAAIDSPSWQVKILDIFLVAMLFGVQRMYRQRLQSARVKGQVHVSVLRELFEQFLDEWLIFRSEDSNLLATVFVGLFSANLGFLAVGTIDELQRTALLVSSVFAVMSVVSGVHHTWQHRPKVDADEEEAEHYLMHAHRLGNQMNLSVTACFLALPVASLLWCIIAFAVALGAFCIQSTDIHSEILLSVALGLLGLLSIATLLFFWHIWKGPRRVEIEDEVVGTPDGWKAAFKRQRREAKAIIGRMNNKASLPAWQAAKAKLKKGTKRANEAVTL